MEVPPPPVTTDDMAGLDASGLPVMSQQIDVVMGLMKIEYDRLRENWNRLLAERDALNKIKDKIRSVNFGENERLRLNVSGTRYEIRSSCVQHNTFFRTLLSGTFANADADGFYYVDRDPRHMMVVLNALREGDVDLDEYNERQLKAIQSDAEFFMVSKLAEKVHRTLAARQKGTDVFSCPINRDVTTSMAYNGAFFEFTVTKRKLNLHSISFVAGESRTLSVSVFFMDGSLESVPSNRPNQVAEIEIDATKGAIYTITFSTIALTGSSYTIGVYSATSPNSVTVCPTSLASRDYSRSAGFVIERSYHTSNARGHITKFNGRDEFDFVGELGMSSSA